MGGVRGFDAFAECGVGDGGEGFHADGFGGVEGIGGEGAACGAVVGDGAEEHASAFVVVGADFGGQGRRVGNGQVRTPQDADFDRAVFDQREADGVLAAAEESHCAVDGVEGPDPAVGAAGAVAGVDGLEHCFFGRDGAAEFVFRDGIFQGGGFHQFPDLAGEGVVSS